MQYFQAWMSECTLLSDSILFQQRTHDLKKKSVHVSSIEHVDRKALFCLVVPQCGIECIPIEGRSGGPKANAKVVFKSVRANIVEIFCFIYLHR